MNSLRTMANPVRLSLVLIALSSLLAASSQTESIRKHQFITITAAGEKIVSVFEGRQPSRYVRDLLILKTREFRMPNLPQLERSALNKCPLESILRRKIVAIYSTLILDGSILAC